MRQITNYRRILIFVGGFAALLVSLLPAQMASASTWKGNIVYVENHTRWNITPVAKQLSGGYALDLRVVRHCPKKSQCIRVHSMWNIPGPAIGYTVNWMVGDRTVASKVMIDSRFYRYATPRERRALLCHELGHAIGLSHSRGYTCMNSGLDRRTSDHLNAAEYRFLKKKYN